MDPKLSNLDPKLQDAYHRVMGSAGNNPAPAPQNSPATQSPASTPPDQFEPQIPPPLDPAPGITPPSQFGDSPQATVNPPDSSTYPENNTAMPPDPSPQPQTDNSFSAQAPDSTPAPQMIDNSTPFPAETPSPTPDVAAEPTPPPAPPIEPDSNNASPVEPAPVQNQQAAPPSAPYSSTVAFNASNSSKNVGTTPIKKGGHALSIIVSLGVILLLVVYAFVWVIIFDVKVPFIPEL